MSTQTASGHSFPTPCKRCGGALYRQVDYCPYCGAVHPLDESPFERPAIPSRRAGAMNQPARRFNDMQILPDEADLTDHAASSDEAAPSEAALHTSLVSATKPMPLLDDPPYPPRNSGLTVRRVLYAIAAVVVIGLAYVAYALFSDNSEPEDNGIDQVTATTQDARTTTGTIAPFAPAESNRPGAAVKPATPGKAAKMAPAAAATSAAPPVTAAALAKPASQFRDATQALHSARLAFRANDLSTAQAALGAALALQPSNTDAQDLAAELRPLAARRDSALQAAQACVAQQSWPCARQHASEALAIDAGNDMAKTILERVIRETGWAPLNPHATTAAPTQGKPLAQAQSALASQPVQLQTPLPQGMPANGEFVAATPRAGIAETAGGAANSVEARERAIKHSVWKRAPSNGGKASTSAEPSQ